MVKKRYKIANKVVEINSMYNEVHDYCYDYITDEEVDYYINIEYSDIEYEREKQNDKNTNKKYTDMYLEILAVYRKIAEKMIDYDTILFHGSAIAVDGEAYIFTAKSGTGKSTHTKLWRECFGDKVTMINDDKPLLKISDRVIVYGTPYDGKHRLSENISAPLNSICIITRSKNNHIEKITKEKAYPMLIQQTYRSNNPKNMKKTFELIDKLIDKVDLYLLECNMDLDAAKIAYEGMK